MLSVGDGAELASSVGARVLDHSSKGLSLPTLVLTSSHPHTCVVSFSPHRLCYWSHPALAPLSWPVGAQPSTCAKTSQWSMPGASSAAPISIPVASGFFSNRTSKAFAKPNPRPQAPVQSPSCLGHAKRISV